jgi:predicted O-methyltransferase YrrM
MTGGGSSLPEMQRLLSVLAAGKRCAEVGTAFGEGAAAMASTAKSLLTVELVAVELLTTPQTAVVLAVRLEATGA